MNSAKKRAPEGIRAHAIRNSLPIANRRELRSIRLGKQAVSALGATVDAAVLDAMIQTRPGLVQALRGLIGQGFTDRAILKRAQRAGAQETLLYQLAAAITALRAQGASHVKRAGVLLWSLADELRSNADWWDKWGKGPAGERYALVKPALLRSIADELDRLSGLVASHLAEPCLLCGDKGGDPAAPSHACPACQKERGA